MPRSASRYKGVPSRREGQRPSSRKSRSERSNRSGASNIGTWLRHAGRQACVRQRREEVARELEGHERVPVAPHEQSRRLDRPEVVQECRVRKQFAPRAPERPAARSQRVRRQQLRVRRPERAQRHEEWQRLPSCRAAAALAPYGLHPRLEKARRVAERERPAARRAESRQVDQGRGGGVPARVAPATPAIIPSPPRLPPRTGSARTTRGTRRDAPA